MKTLIIHNAGGYWTTALWLNDQRISGYAGVIDIPDQYVGDAGLKPGYRLEGQTEHGPVELTSYEDVLVEDGRGGSLVFDGPKTVHAVLEPRQITREEKARMTVPELPDAHWLRECYRLGLNPLPTCRKSFPHWKWTYYRGAGETGVFELNHTGTLATFPVYEQKLGGGYVTAERQ